MIYLFGHYIFRCNSLTIAASNPKDIYSHPLAALKFRPFLKCGYSEYRISNEVHIFLLNLCIPSFFGSSNFRAPGSELRSYPAKTGDAGPDKSGYQQDTFFFRNAARFLPHISYPVIFNNVESFGQFLLGNTEILSYFFITFDFALSIGKTQINLLLPATFSYLRKDGPKP